jgi:flavin reductase (DIM6/NTAB) family NADH-FMN oxidoreductase RutF
MNAGIKRALESASQRGASNGLKRYSSTLSDRYKKAMSGVAAPANIVTTINGDEPRGLTVSSVTSLSVWPDPLVSFNIQIPSRTSQVLHQANKFAINVLSGTAESVRLCKAFAGGYGAQVNPFEKFKEEIDFTGHNHGNIPVINHASAILFCQKEHVFRTQDHEIWIAKIYDVENNSSNGNLLYQNRSFHILGKEIDGS